MLRHINKTFNTKVSFPILHFNRSFSTRIIGNISEKHLHLFGSKSRDFLSELDNKFTNRHHDILNFRKNNIINGYRNDTVKIRNDLNWKARQPNIDLKCRHVEITGPADNAKMMINALNSSADCYMTDVEDSMSPSWTNVLNAHNNIFFAMRGLLQWKKIDENGKVEKEYKLIHEEKNKTPVFFTRLRGLHLFDKGIESGKTRGEYPSTLTDFGLYMANNAQYLMSGKQYTKGGIYFYIPKIESYEEAQYIHDVFAFGEEYFNIPMKTIQATLLIETYPAIYQTEEIIYALRDYICGLNCGRWDYLFSLIKNNMNLSIPDRSLLTMDRPFMRAYVEQIVKSTHQRGIHAMGGMSAFIPTGSVEKNEKIRDKIITDKIGEISLGCDGAWVAHPDLIKTVKDLFMERLKGKDNQYEKIPHIDFKGDEFLNFGDKLMKMENFTEKEFRNNLNISLQYLAGWLHGNGAVALNNLMEDMATCEISLYQIKNWVHNSVPIINVDDDNTIIDVDLDNFMIYLEEEYMLLKSGGGNLQVEYALDKLDLAKECICEYVLNLDKKFLPDVAYKYL